MKRCFPRLRVVNRPKFVLLALLGCSTAFSQVVTFGVKGGARLTDDLQSSPGVVSATVSESKRYTLGPMVEFKLPFHLGLEVDALYKRVGTSEFEPGPQGYQERARDRSNSWEFPILAKYRFPGKRAKPYASGGYAIRAISGSGVAEISYCCGFSSSATQTVVDPYPTSYKVSQGVVAGGGLEIKAGPLRVSPEFRYTRWNNSALSVSPLGFNAESARDQAEILVGISWH